MAYCFIVAVVAVAEFVFGFSWAAIFVGGIRSITKYKSNISKTDATKVK